MNAAYPKRPLRGFATVVLAYVILNPRCTSREIADYLGVKTTQAASALQTLHSRGYVGRQTALMWGQPAHWQATDAGIEEAVR